MKFNLIAILFLSIFSFSAKAQNLAPDEKTDSTFSKCHRDVFFEPGSKTVITAEEITERGYDNLDELLASVPGIHITHDRTFTQIGFRGSSATATNNHRVKVFLDGLPMNNPMTGQAPSGYDLRGINPEDLKEVIVERTPSAVISGNNAMLGVIRINTKSPEKNVRVNFDTGSYGELDGGFSAARTFGKKTLVNLSGRLADIAGQELYIAGDSAVTKEANDFAGLALRIAHAKFWLRANYLQRNESVPVIPGKGFRIFPDTSVSINQNPPRTSRNYVSQVLDRQGTFREKGVYVDLGYAGPVKKNQDIETRVFFNYYQNERQRSLLDFEADSLLGTSLMYDEAPTQKTYWGGFSYKHDFRFTPEHILQVGTDLTAVFRSKFATLNAASSNPESSEFDTDGNLLNRETLDLSPGVLDYLAAKNSIYDETFPYWAFSIFARDCYRVREKFQIVGGLRADINSQTKPILAPELAFTYTPFSEGTNGGNTAIYFHYGRGYRIPSPVETQVPIAGGTIRDEDFTPEYSNNFELGLKQKIGKYLRLDVNGFHMRPQDLVWNEAVGLPSQPDTIISVTGLGVGLSVRLPEGIQTYLNYDFQFESAERVNMPSPMCKFGLSVPFLNYFNLYAEGQYEGSRETIHDIRTLPYFLMNANLLFRPKTKNPKPSTEWINRSSLAFRMYNIFDQFYQHPSMQDNQPELYPQNGRTWQAQLTLEF